jgi:non-ribosomal peptide synthase protein (TIGR01720 family)
MAGETVDRELIAIVGMAGRFPGAANVDAFWANLRDGVESIRPFTDAELRAAGADSAEPGFVNAGAVMDGIDEFDAPFFGLSRREAELTDPQHRVLLETAWTALEHAGYDAATYDGRIGVFGGVGPNLYFRNNVSGHPEILARVGDYPLLLATEREYAITRVAYKLGLKGPAISLNTACSTSAVAVHLASQSLLSGESDLALAGACRIRVPATGGYVYQEDGIPSPDGHCRTFDADARGTVLASGAAMVVLKRLSEAVEDGDTIYAVIRGSAVNNDGAAKIGFTAPGMDGQVAVIEEALAVADVDADSIGMVEAHGTGTSLGDPIEIAALTRAWRGSTSRRQYCAIGSLKTNIGHLDAAAGVAGIIKAALALHHEQIPPSLNFRRPNPQIDFGGSPFFVNTELRPWPRSGVPRRAAVSSFGLGGTNAHLVLEEAPLREAAPAASGEHRLVTLSARSPAALERLGSDLAEHLERTPDVDLGDVAYTLQVGRARLPHRRSFVAATVADAARQLRAPEATAGDRAGARDGARVAFLFPGQGAQHPGMGADLYRNEPAFAAAMDECARILRPILGRDLLELVYPEGDDPRAAADALGQAAIAQPATFAIEYALARLWMSWGIQPAVMVGHSLGEFAAACLAGVFPLEDALRIVAGRGRLMQDQPGGAMLAVMLEPEAVQPLLDPGTSIAAINAAGQVVASGPAASIARLEKRLVADEVEVHRLPIGLAAHSPMMDAIVGQFRELVRGAVRRPLELPIVSTVTGGWTSGDQMADPEYWATHLRQTVRFADATGVLLDQPDLILLEVGPGQTLTSLVRQHPQAADRVLLASLRHPRRQLGDGETMLHALGQIWAAGGTVDWPAVHGRGRTRVPLPTYPFDHERYWIDAVAPARTDVPSARAAEESSVAGEPAGEGPVAVAADPGGAGHPEAAADRPAPVAATVAPAQVGSRRERIVAQLASILSELSGIEPTALDPKASFADLGFDSLFLTQANAQFRKQFGVRITFRQIFEEAPSIDSLAGFIDGKLAPDALPAPVQPAGPAAPPATPAAATPAAATPAAASSADTGAERAGLVPTTDSGAAGGIEDHGGSPVERLIREQLRIMEQQLELMRGGDVARISAPPAMPRATASMPAATASMPAAPAPDAPAAAGIAGPASPARTEAEPPVPAKGHYLATRDQGHRPASRDLTDRQRGAIEELVRRADARTPGSKRLAQQWRPRLADNRAIVGFDPAWKELVYQVVAQRSSGSRIWDVDGNEYIDTALGFGTNLFGHSPDFVVDAVREQLGRGFAVGVQSDLLGEVSEMACAMTANERLAFTTSGGEAVETAIRVARTVTGRDRLAYFTDDIHGRSDIVLGRAVDLRGDLRTVPMVAGVPQRVVDDAFVLEYGTERALEIIRANADDLALVLVEPVRSRNPDLQPVEFLRELRRLADQHGFLLVFDEIVTGFRVHQRGVQGLLGLRADLTTYGKVLGGGLPIGVVAGSSRFIDVIDGGPWAYGDDSFPEADITASGGTMIKHALTLAASRAVLRHLQEQGPALQAELNRRTAEAVAAINDPFTREGLPIHVEQFGSFFRPTFVGSTRFAGLFQYYLRERGIHTNPPSPSFLSTAHSEADIEAVVAGYLAAGREMAGAGFLDVADGAHAAVPDRVDRTPAEAPLPLLPNVARFLVERSTPDPDHWNLGVLLQRSTPLDPVIVRRAVEAVLERHDALRMRFHKGSNGWEASIAPVTEPVPFSSHDLSGLPADEQRTAIERQAEELQRSLSLQKGPLIRFATFDLGENGQRLLVVVHHFAMDGLSWRPFWDDFDAVLAGLEGGTPIELPPETTSFAEWTHLLKERADSPELRNELRAWLDLPWDEVRPLPLDHPAGDGANTNASAREVVLEFTVEETRAIFQETPGVPHKVDFLVTALAQAFAAWMEGPTVLIDMMGHGRDEDAFESADLFGTVGFFISYTPMVLTPAGSSTSAGDLLTEQIQPILRGGLDFDLLRYMTSDATIRQTFSALPRAQILFNHLGKRDELDTVPPGSTFALADESMGNTHSPSGIRYYPLAVSSQVWRDQLRLNFVYSEALHLRSTVEGLAEDFKRRILALAARHAGPGPKQVGRSDIEAA